MAKDLRESQLEQRRHVARAASESLRHHAGGLTALGALVGFDGFVDDILDAVRVRRSMALDDYERIGTITEFADRVRAAAGVSTNIELVRRESRFGGNGPLLASGLLALGMPTMFVGCIGRGEPAGGQRAIDPLFEGFARSCGRAVAIGAPGHTDALEFADGKIMFNQTAPVQSADWDALVRAIGVDVLRSIVRGVSLIGMVNWSLCGGVETIWEGLISQVLPDVRWQGSAAQRRVFVDLSDPAKRSDSDLRRGLGLLRRMNTLVPVTLGLNMAEGVRVASALGAGVQGAGGPAEAVPRLAHAIREAAGLHTVVIHPRAGAGAATADGQNAWFEGPVVRSPLISTGAGDHFNAGFAGSQVLGLALTECLAIGTACSGCYVRDGQSPSLERVAGLLEQLPEPEVG